MDEKIRDLMEKNSIIKEYASYPKEELQIIRMYLILELVRIYKEKDMEPKIKMIKSCFSEPYSYLDYMLSLKYKVDVSLASTEETLDNVKKYIICPDCKCKNCIKKGVGILLNEIDKYNQYNNENITYLEVIDYLLNRKAPEFKEIPDDKFFKSVDLMDLLYVQIILEADLITLLKQGENEIEFDYLDLTQKENNEYYVNLLLEYYKNRRNAKQFKIDISSMDSILKEKDKITRVYKIAAYYKYLMEVKKIDIIQKLRKLLKSDNIIQGIKIRAYYFINKSFQKVEQLPYSKKSKEKIYNILNYILNYRFNKGTPYIPINILIYTNDKEGVETISGIIGEFMWFFGYLPDNMRYYSEYINNVILDKFLIKKLYDDKDKKKRGILLLHNFENLLYTDYMQQNLILNILTDEMESNNNKVCTIIYGEGESLKQLIGNHHKLSQMLINLELEIDNLDIDKIYELVIKKIEKNIYVSAEVKEKIYHYIKATYQQSDVQNMEYVNKLYHLIILNMNNTFSIKKKCELKIKDVPEAYNTRDLPTIMKDLNALVGLKEIKEQINDLVALLKFNKKSNIDIKNFNLHMVFSGNPGTGKTTVGRLITDIFFNLGYINQNKLTEVTAKDLIAEYLGQTSGKTFSVVKSALGGVLFIDEAYAITSGSEDGTQYGNECIATLLKLMEDYKDKLIIIFAGYNEEMEQFQKTNPGLVSRIGYKINFPDFTLEELVQIFVNLLKDNKLEITEEALNKLRGIIEESSSFDDFGNARYINNIFQKILIEHSKNVEQASKKTNLYLITEQDILPEKLMANNKRKKIGF